MGALHGTDIDQFRFRSQHLSSKSGDNSHRPRLGQVKASCTAGRGMTVLIILFYRKKNTFYILNNKKDKNYNCFSNIHQSIVLPDQNLGAGHFPSLPDGLSVMQIPFCSL